MSKADEEDIEKEALDKRSTGFDERLKRNIYVLSITMGMMILFFGWNNFFPLYIIDLGANEVEVGIFYAIVSFAHALSAILFSRISDGRGRKPFVIAGTFSAGVAYASFILFKSWILLIIPFFIQQLLHAAYINPMQAMMAESAPSDRRGTASGVFSTLGGVFNIMAPILATSLIFYFAGSVSEDLRYLTGMPYLFLICGGVMMMVTFARWVLLRETYKSTPDLSDTSGEAIAGNPGARNNPGIEGDSGTGQSLRSKAVFGLYSFIVLASFMLATINYYLVVFLKKELLIPDFQIGIWASVAIGANTIAQIPTGKLVDKYSKKMLLLVAVILYVIAILLFLNASDFSGAILAQIPFSVGNALIFNTEFAMVAAYSPSRSMSTAYSIQTAIFDITFIPGPVLGGLLYSISPFFPFMFILIMALPTFIVGILFVRDPIQTLKEKTVEEPSLRLFVCPYCASEFQRVGEFCPVCGLDLNKEHTDEVSKEQ